MSLSQRIKERARALGFDLVGISPVEPLRYGESFAAWLRRGFFGEMGYMERTAEKRLHPGQFLPWARSVLSVGLNYYAPPRRPPVSDGARGWISRYAWGDDYHETMERKLEALLAEVGEMAGQEVQGRMYVDAGPVLERDVGSRAGIGWVGKNTMLLNPHLGSYFFLGELFLNLPLDYDQPIKDRCGQCDLCIRACPTGALVGPYLLDGRRCISYLTIELRGSIPREMRPLIGNHIFGCDICQEVCPYNAVPHPTAEPAFAPRRGLQAPDLIPLLSLTEDEFRTRFRGSPIRRTKRQGLVRNAAVALGNLRCREAVPALVRTLSEDPDAVVRGHAAWALGQIGTAGARRALEQALEAEGDSEVRAETLEAIEGWKGPLGSEGEGDDGAHGGERDDQSRGDDRPERHRDRGDAPHAREGDLQRPGPT